jgi:hypothetical protein
MSDDRKRWVETAKTLKATHVFVVCDSFSYELLREI